MKFSRHVNFAILRFAYFIIIIIKPFRSQWSIGPRKPLLAILVCFGLSFQAATRCSLLCSPRHLPSSSSCFWDGLGSSSPVGKKICSGFFLGGDHRVLLIVVGSSGATSDYACLWCKIHKLERFDVQT